MYMGGNIKNGSQRKCESTDYILLAQDTVQGRALANMMCVL